MENTESATSLQCDAAVTVVILPQFIASAETSYFAFGRISHFNSGRNCQGYRQAQ
jgi:hypothetical protein